MNYPIYNPEDPSGFNTYPSILNALGLETGLYFHYLVYRSQKEQSWDITTSISEISRQFHNASRYSIQKSLKQLEHDHYIREQQTQYGLIIHLSPIWESQITNIIRQKEEAV